MNFPGKLGHCPREREKLLLAILALSEETPTQSKGRINRVKWPDLEARAKRIFGSRVLPNLVLPEREEQPRPSRMLENQGPSHPPITRLKFP